jgi:hypothetical protein
MTLRFRLGRRPLHSPERVEPLENQPARVAKQFMKADEAKNDHRVVIVTLNPFTLASWAPHLSQDTRKQNRQRKSLIIKAGSC